MNSRDLNISISSRMYNLSIFFDCILILTNVSNLFKFCGNGGLNHILVHLGVLVAELVLMVQISERVVLRKCKGYLGKKFVWIFGGF